MIVLIGYMGSGKSTLGRLLAKESGAEFVDLDKKIEEKTGKNIPQIFELYGEYFFRKIEYIVLKEELSKRVGVLATGGGTPTFFDSMNLINTKGTSVYIKVSTSELVSRLMHESETRPIIQGKSETELNRFISNHLKEREEYYSKAHHLIENNVQEEAMRLLRKLANSTV